MNDNILVKLKNAGFRIKNKWLVQSVSFQVEKYTNKVGYVPQKSQLIGPYL